MHQHYWVEIVYTCAGSTRMQYLLDDRLVTTDLLPGEMLFLFPNIPHRYIATSGTGAREFYTVTFNPNINVQFQELCHHTAYAPLIADTNQLHEDIRYILHRFFNRDITACSLGILESYLTIFLERLSPCFKSSADRRLPERSCATAAAASQITHTEAALNLLDYIHSHYNEDLSLESAARQSGINKYNISRFFSQQMQISFSAYINSLRLSAAQTLLANTDREITDIMLECGFKNQQVFNRNFKKMLGMTPSQYRNKCGHFSLCPADARKNILFYEQKSETQNILYMNGKYVCIEPAVIPVANDMSRSESGVR